MLWAFKVANYGKSPCGIAFRPAKANQAHANPKNVDFFFIVSPLSAAVFEVPQQPSKAIVGSHAIYNSRASKIKHFVTDTNGASACGLLRVRVCVRVSL